MPVGAGGAVAIFGPQAPTGMRRSTAALCLRISIVLNRAVLIVRFRQSFVDWVNAADPTPKHTITLADVNDDSNAYLVDVEDEKELAEWLALNGDILFEEVLNDWYTDPDLWPQDRSLIMFKRWCSFELHTVVLDTGDSPLGDDEAAYAAET